MEFLSNGEMAKWVEYYVDRETTGAIKRVEDTEPAVQQEQDDTRKVENAGLTNREPKKPFQQMMVAIADSLSDLASSDDGEDGEDDDDEETERGELTEYDEPSWVMGTITITVQQHMEMFQQKQMKLDELTEPEWEDAADYFRETNKKYDTSKLSVLAVVEPPTDDDAGAHAPTTFGERV